MKIAPTLQSLTFDDGKWSKMHPTVNSAMNQAEKELRALLAVARATDAATWHDCPKGSSCPKCLRLCRALARLEKVSR